MSFTIDFLGKKKLFSIKKTKHTHGEHVKTNYNSWVNCAKTNKNTDDYHSTSTVNTTDYEQEFIDICCIHEILTITKETT